MALQETKVKDEDFPKSIFYEIGYDVIFYGQPSYNGVAIAFKQSIFHQPKLLEKNIPNFIVSLKNFNDNNKDIYKINFKNIHNWTISKWIEMTNVTFN